MEFDFLPNLPKSNLDDRTYKDLVDECVLRIPRYCPEWTNHNPADPGITLVELFAWLTDQMLFRFNQVPRRNYVAFLELLGVRLQPPSPARTEVTFYLTRPQSALDRLLPIPAATEVATERTETEEAIVFSTDRDLTIGVPLIRHFLTAEQAVESPQLFTDRLANRWRQDETGRWSGQAQPVFLEQPQTGNCFYLVFDSAEPLEGNVISLQIEGEPAASTGIDPENPPRRWEAWDGETWQPILQRESHDGTRGFSFNTVGTQNYSSVQSAQVMLHLPLNWLPSRFSSYFGRWLRCVCTHGIDPAPVPVTGMPPLAAVAPTTPAYSRAPRFTALVAQSVGGTVQASQCSVIEDELLGESTGQPGQTFQLQSGSVLPRTPEEHVVVITPEGELQADWREVPNFANSTAEDRHYTLDSTTGTVQFGPLIREPSQLKEEVEFRRQVQHRNALTPEATQTTLEALERQYGAVPPRGSTVRMQRYRTGGGQQGNIQPEKLTIIKSARSYVSSVVNYKPAINGADAESLDEAVIRVPRLLRTRDRAVTPEDFEALTMQASRAVARSYCPKQQVAGQVKVLVVPRAELLEDRLEQGIAPDQFRLSPQLRAEVMGFLDERRLLGIEVELAEPTYIGVSVQAEVWVTPQHRSAQAKQDLRHRLLADLYRFLNPITGGYAKTGWDFGEPLYRSDIVGLLQQVPGVQYLGTVELFVVDPQRQSRTLAPEGRVNPGSTGLICSWADAALRSGHTISVND